jgi:DNA-binding beta-propeller fold protein YncE
VGITAVATHPRTGVFYGITGGLSPAVPRSLVTVDLDSARATLVAPISMRGSDLAFGPDGTLYMWVPEAKRLVKVDPDSGAIEALGPSGIEAGPSGGLAIDRGGGKAYVAATGANGTLDEIDLETGKGTMGPKLAGAPFAVSIDNMTIAPSGVLYAVNSNGGAPSNAALVTIDAASGAITRVGTLPRDTRGLIFAPERARLSTWEEARKWILVALAVVAVALMIVAWRVR